MGGGSVGDGMGRCVSKWNGEHVSFERCVVKGYYGMPTYHQVGLLVILTKLATYLFLCRDTLVYFYVLIDLKAIICPYIIKILLCLTIILYKF